MQLNGSQIVMECLLEQGVDTIFGYPGGAILNIYDTLYQYEKEGKLKHILTSHEQGAAHAADGYARATGKTGVCFATSGPGATNLVTGIATAYMDSVPLVAITCNVGRALIGKDSFQEIDIAGVCMPITKYSFLVEDVESLAGTIRRAFRIAAEGRKGPVLVDITKDVTAALCEFKPGEDKTSHYVKPVPTDDQIDEVVNLIENAKKPYLFVGGGCALSGAEEQVRELAEKIDCPVCDTLMGKGVFPAENPRYTGMLGMHGTKTSNFGVSHCDLLIAVGVRFSDRVTGNASKFVQNGKIVHIDLDAAEINKNVRADYPLVGDAREVLERINSNLNNLDHSDWMKQVEEASERYPVQIPDGFSCPYVVSEICKKTGGDAIISTDVGQHQMWSAQYYEYKEPHQLITSGGLGTMGYGLGAAIGAAIGRPDKKVVNVTGDGCFRMNMNELATASRNNLPIVEVIINNHVLGMVRQWQSLYYGKRYSATVLDDGMDYVKVAEGMGCRAKRVCSREEFDAVIDEALKSEGPYVIDCIIDSDEKVWPMVSPGATLSDTFDEKDLESKKED
ncbi:MAG: biosynthetic-type acetolactate synthase large subunit [Eubacterium sp.]|nr:biosynthetic-type acetolactate synthase large subunit [Eubacterium sp.]